MDYNKQTNSKRTFLYDSHVALGALISPFAGFDMPIQYVGIIEEHLAVRNNVGMFDVSHMGEVVVKGQDAERFVQYIFTNDIANAPVGKVFYGMMCYEDGGTVDDLLVYKMDVNNFLLVINASNIDKDWEWINKNKDGFNVELINCSDCYGQIALQGPNSSDVMKNVLAYEVNDMTFYTVKTFDDVIISRTGYTGEDGFEIYADKNNILDFWNKLIDAGVQPCGLGCRDTLRFEAGLPLYGNELSERISPIMAGLSMFVKFDKQDFIGKEALYLQKNKHVDKTLIGIELRDKAIPRHGYDVIRDENVIGYVTTGYHMISVDKSVCMALVDSSCATLGTELKIQIRKKVFPGTVVKKRFYEKRYKK